MEMPAKLREKLETERRQTVRRAYEEIAQLGIDRRRNDSAAICTWINKFEEIRNRS